jgi:TolB-like protein
MKYFVLIVTFSLLIFSCASSKPTSPPADSEDTLVSVSDRLVDALFSKPKEYHIAILPFENDGSSDAVKFSSLLQDEMISAIFRNNLTDITLYERTSLNKIIDEQNLGMSGIIENPIEIGKMISAKEIIIGKTNYDNGSIHITAKIVDVENGSIINSVSDIMGSDRAKLTINTMNDKINDGEYKVKRLEFLIDWSPKKEQTVIRIEIENDIWTEYNSYNNLIGQGNLTLHEDRTFGVTWTTAIVDSMIGNTTKYEYTFSEGIFVVRIIGKNNLIGFIELEKI